MADFTPYLTLGIGFFAGWTIKLLLIKRSENRDDLKEIRTEYLRLTKDEPLDNILEFRMTSLLEAGALRLGTKEFEKLLSDISKHRKEVVLEPLIAKVFSVKAAKRTKRPNRE